MKEFSERENELIFKYINGLLTEADRALFDEKMKEYSDFRTEVLAYEDAKLAAIVGSKSNIKEILKDEAAKYQTEQKLKKFKLTYYVKYAAAAAIILTTGLLLYHYIGKQKYDNNQLFAQNFKDLDELPITKYRSGNAIEIDKDFKKRHDSLDILKAIKVFDNYTQKNYTGTITAIEQIGNLDDTLNLTKAMAFISLNKMLEAENILTNLSLYGKGYTKNYAEWNLSLIYLKQNKINQTEIILNNIKSNSDHPYYSNAVELLKVLK